MTSKSSGTSRTEASKAASVILSPYLMRRHREQVADWLHANGVDPNLVSADHPIQVKGDTIHYRAFDLDTEGKPVMDEGAGSAVTVARTARCDRPAPDLVHRVDETG